MGANNKHLASDDFSRSLEKLKQPLSLPESEESWDEILNALEGLKKLCQLAAGDHGSEIIAILRSLHRNIVGAMNSERTRLSGAALDVLSVVASSLGPDFEPVLPLYFPAILSLCGRANKVVVSRAKSCVLVIIEATQLSGILNHLAQFVKDKSPTVRLVVAEGTLTCLKCFNPPDLEKESLSLATETIIRGAARDANANIRKVGKDVFQTYKVVLPHRVESFTAPLTPTIRKYLQLSGVAEKHRKIVPQPAPRTVAEPRNSASQPATQNTKAQPNVPTGPIRSVKTSALGSKSNHPVEPAEPLRTIQVSAKRGERPLTKEASQRQPPTLVSRPFAPAKHAVGPQRVMKPLATLSGGASVAPNDRQDILGRPSRSRAASTSSQPPAKPTKQATAGRKLQTSVKPPVDTDRTRDPTRPTLSQLARVRQPVNRPVTRVVRGLEIRKAKSTVDGASTVVSSSTLGTKLDPATAPTGSGEILRPKSPSSIPLPPSPKLNSVEPSTPIPDQSVQSSPLGEEFREQTPEAQSGETATMTPVAGVEDSASTPVVRNAFAPDLYLHSKTPISALLSSIQQGFDLTPCTPLSPPEHYLNPSVSPLEGGVFRLGIIRQDVPTEP